MAGLAILSWTKVPGQIRCEWKANGRAQHNRCVRRFDAAKGRSVDKGTARLRRPDHFPTEPTTKTEAVKLYGT